MKLGTIWTIPAMSTTERIKRTREWGFRKISSSLPAKIKYYVTMQQLANVTFKLPQDEVPAITMEQILQNLNAPKGID